MDDPQAITYLGEANFRNRNTKFGIKSVDRSRHMYVIGKSGTGKSTFLENLAIQDIQRGSGLMFVDPHGGSAEKLLEYIPEHRKQDVVYFAPFDIESPISFNVMEDVGPDKRHFVAAGLMSAFKKIWVDAWSARMEYILTNTLLALLEYPGSTLLGVNRMYSDKDYRKKVVDNISDMSVKSFWVNEFAKYDEKNMREYVAAIQNKIGQFTVNPLIRNIIGQSKSSFDLRDAMDNRKIVIVNLSIGRLGEQNAALLGAMLITKTYLAAMSRADNPAHVMASLPSFFFYADEFQNFANESFADILSQARKYKLCLTLAHQYVEQLPETLRSAIFGNVGSMVVFRVGPMDAELFEKDFAPVFLAEDFTNLGFRQMYLRISIDGIGSKPFSAKSLNMIPNSQEGGQVKKDVEEISRGKYGHPRAEVEKMILEWYGNSKPEGMTAAEGRPSESGNGYQKRPADAKPSYGTRPRPDPSAPQQPTREFAPRPSDRPVTGFRRTDAAVAQVTQPVPAPKPEPIPEEVIPEVPIQASDSLQSLMNQFGGEESTPVEFVAPAQVVAQKSVEPAPVAPKPPVQITPKPVPTQIQTKPQTPPARPPQQVSRPQVQNTNTSKPLPPRAPQGTPQNPIAPKQASSVPPARTMLPRPATVSLQRPNDRSASVDSKQSLKDLLSRVAAQKPAPLPEESKPSAVPISQAPQEQKFVRLGDLVRKAQEEPEEVILPKTESVPNSVPTVFEPEHISDGATVVQPAEIKTEEILEPKIETVAPVDIIPEAIQTPEEPIASFADQVTFEVPQVPEQKEQEQVSQTSSYTPRRPKEVPEDILRSILQ